MGKSGLDIALAHAEALEGEVKRLREELARIKAQASAATQGTAANHRRAGDVTTDGASMGDARQSCRRFDQQGE